MRDSEKFVRTLDTLRVNHKDISFSFDAVSLFIRVPHKDVLNLLSQHFDEDNLRLFCHVLMSSFSVPRTDEQIGGLATSSSPSPVTTNFFMEDLEEEALKRASNKPLSSISIKETTEIELHPDNMNREKGFSLTGLLKSLIRDPKTETGSHQHTTDSSRL